MTSTEEVTMQMVVEDIRRVVMEAPVGEKESRRISYYIKHGAYNKAKVYKFFPKTNGGWEVAIDTAVPQFNTQPKIHRVKEKPRHVVKNRECLAPNCGKSFRSYGAHNRICGNCKKMELYLHGESDSVYSIMPQ